MTFAERLRKERKAARMTQAELASKLGVTPTVIGQYERGVRNPKFDALRRIATALGVELTALVDFNVSNEFPGDVQVDFSKPVIFADKDFQEKFFLRNSDVVAGKLPTGDVLAVENANNDNALKAVNICEAIELYLNDDGKQKVAEYVRDIMQIAEYRKAETTMLPKDGEPE